MFRKWIDEVDIAGMKKKIEIREDEFFGRRCRIIGRVGLELVVEENFEEMINKPCIFCTPEKLAKFGKEFGKEIFENESAFLFPNINPYAKYSSVCAFKKHFIEPAAFNAKLIEKNLELCIEYIQKVIELDEIKYASISWNYLMPAGASILHPHTQVIADKEPTTYMAFITKNNTEFKKYLEEEMKSERYIGRIGKIELFTPFVPFGFNEVVGLAKENIENCLGDLSNAIEKIISYYASIGRNSFNVAIYISLKNNFPLHFRSITRQNMVKYYRNDAMFFERLHQEVILERKPEEVAEEIRNFI